MYNEESIGGGMVVLRMIPDSPVFWIAVLYPRMAVPERMPPCTSCLRTIISSCKCPSTGLPIVIVAFNGVNDSQEVSKIDTLYYVVKNFIADYIIGPLLSTEASTNDLE